MPETAVQNEPQQTVTDTFGRFWITVDCVVFGVDFAANTLKVVLVRRSEEPFADCWALPGGFVLGQERTDEAARRTLARKTGLTDIFLEQLYTFDDPQRDTRAGDNPSLWAERIITVAYFALVSSVHHQLACATEANVTAAQWFSVTDLDKMTLAFDHAPIIELALTRLRGKLSYVPIGFELLESKFTLKELQRVYEIVLGRTLDGPNFRRRAMRLGILEALPETQANVAHRPAQLYCFNEARYQQMKEEGFAFEL